MIGVDPLGASPATAGVGTDPQPRLTERHVLTLGLAVSAVFVLAAAIAAAHSIASGGGAWSAIHLALAGAATTAICAFIPHFAVTMAGTRPEPVRQRFAGLALVATGSAMAVAGIEHLGGGWAAAGAVAMLGALGMTAWQTVAPLRDPLARRHHVVTAAYLVALAELATGIAIGGMLAAGHDGVVGAWASLRPAHAWLTVFGAVSLTIFATLVYLAPTVMGARIRATRWLTIGVIGMLVGPPLAALGFALDHGVLAVGGAAIASLGAGGQVAYMVDTYRRRGPFTSEHDWRRVAVWHLVMGTGWFAAAVAIVVVDLAQGGTVAGWSIGALAVPLVGGWMLQELVGSWTHLAPAVTPGSAARNAAQRRMLARGSRIRPVGWNLGVAGAWIGLGLDIPLLAGIGAALLGAAVVVSAVLLLRALTIGSY